MKYQEVTLNMDKDKYADEKSEPNYDESTERSPVSYVPGVDTCLRGWYIFKDADAEAIRSSNRRLVVFFHENAGNIGLRLDYFELLYKRLNCDVFVIAYRGFSESDGTPNEEAIKSDMVQLNEYIRAVFKHKYYNAGGIFLLGRSLGGAVGTYLAALNESETKEDLYRHGFNGLVLENTFTSIDDMVDHIFSIVRLFKSLILRMHWNTAELIGDIKSPILFVIGDKDEIVPWEMGAKLYDMAKGSMWRDILIVKDGEHNDTWIQGNITYVEKLNAFFNKCVEVTGQQYQMWQQQSQVARSEADITSD